MGGDDEWAALEHGQRRAADQRDGHSGILYVCLHVHIAMSLNSLADCSQSEDKASRDRSNIEAGVASFATLFYRVLYNPLHSHEIPARQG